MTDRDQQIARAQSLGDQVWMTLEGHIDDIEALGLKTDHGEPLTEREMQLANMIICGVLGELYFRMRLREE